MRFVLPATLVAVLFSQQQAWAQSALDRVDPNEVPRELAPPNTPPAMPAPRVEAPQKGAVPAAALSYQVGAIALTGLRVLDPSAFVDILGEYSGRVLSGAEVKNLADRVARRMRERGYPLASAWIAPQPLNGGVLFVSVDEGVIDRIDVRGANEAAIRAALAPLVNGQPVTLAELERRLLLAGDIDGMWIRRSRFERQGDAGVLVIDARQDRAAARLVLENDGSRPIGPEQARLDVDFNGVFAADDALSLSYGTTPLEPEELQFGRARYTKRISPHGTEASVGGYISTTHPGSYLADRDIFGRGWHLDGTIRHPVMRSRAASLWVEGSFDLRDLRQERSDVLVRHDRVAALRAGVYGLGDVAGGRGRGRLTLSQGLDAFGATQRGDPLASREDASPTFTMVSAWFDWTRSLDRNVSIRLSGLGQLSSEPLLISEDLGLGGSRFLRGYNYSERSGDQGVIGSGELRYDWVGPMKLVRRAQFYAYADGGVVGNLENGRGSGSLASGGGGIRTAVTRDLAVDLQLAFPLTGPRYDTDDMSPRVNFQLRQSF